MVLCAFELDKVRLTSQAVEGKVGLVVRERKSLEACIALNSAKRDDERLCPFETAHRAVQCPVGVVGDAR